MKGKKVAPQELILKELRPLAQAGLAKAGIDSADSDQYLGIIEARAKSGRTGSQWMLDSFSAMQRKGVPRDEIVSAITSSVHHEQYQGKPVHEWELACLEKIEYEPSSMLVEEFMNTDLITVKEDDILDLPATLMDWRYIRHVAVEDEKDKLVGVVTARMLLRHFAQRAAEGNDGPMLEVREVMRCNPATVKPDDTIMHALELMQGRKVGCLPVCKEGRLVGMITEVEFLTISSNLMRRLARKREQVSAPTTSQANHGAEPTAANFS